MTSVAVERRTWLFGPLPDLLFGCGLLYALGVVALAGSGVAMETLSGWLPFVVLCTGVPHYGATLLRVYGTADARRRYARYGLYFGLAVWATFAFSLATPDFGRWFITLYLTWSPWHYTAQNFGLAMMFLQRGGFAVSFALRRLVKLSFVLSYVVIFAGIHGARSSGGSDPLYSAEGGYQFASLEIPDAIVQVVLWTAMLAYLCVSVVMIHRLLRQGRASRLTPVLALVASQLVWFVVPVLVGRNFPGLFGPKGPTALAFFWVAIAHSVQYLWISVYYARASGIVAATVRGTSGYLGAAILVGAALWIYPAYVCAPGALGILTFDGGLGLLVASAVNLHHFLLDGVIWKLRDVRVGEALVSKAIAGVAPAASPRPRASWPLRVAFVAIGAVAVTFWSVGTWEKEVGYRRAARANDVERLELASRRLALVGRDGPGIHEELGRQRARRGQLEQALDEYRKSQALAPMPAAWSGMSAVYQDAWTTLRNGVNRMRGHVSDHPDD